MGSGDYRYEIVDSWPKMPKYWSFGGPSGAAVNSDDEVYVFSRGVHPVTIWDTDGNFISSWGEGKFRGPHGIHVAPDDHVWLTDMYEHVVTKHAPGGERLLELGMRMMPSPAWDARPFNMPTGVASTPDGGVVVSDGYGGHRVHCFDADGNLRLSWGGPGSGPGEFALLHNIGVDGSGRIFVCDREADRIQIFDGKAGSSRSGPTSPARATCGSATWSTSSSSSGPRTQHLDAGRGARHALARRQRPGQGRVHVVPRRVRRLAGEHLRHRAGPRQGG